MDTKVKVVLKEDELWPDYTIIPVEEVDEWMRSVCRIIEVPVELLNRYERAAEEYMLVQELIAKATE